MAKPFFSTFTHHMQPGSPVRYNSNYSIPWSPDINGDFGEFGKFGKPDNWPRLAELLEISEFSEFSENAIGIP